MISVIIPVYNLEYYLHICLNSILKQTYDDFEIICIDDASTDSSWEILKYFTNKDSRIKILKNEINQGKNFCLNKGLDIAQGNLVYILDGKGWLNLDAFDILNEIAEKNSLDILMFKSIIFDEKDNSFEFEYYYDVEFMNDLNLNVFNKNDLEDFMQFLIANAPLNKFYSKSFLIENDINFDNDFFNRVFESANNISFINRSFYNIRNQANDIASINDKFTSFFNIFINEFAPFIPQDDEGFIKIINMDLLLIFDLLDNFEKFLIKKNLFNYFKTIFLKFKLSNFINYLNNCPKNHKNVFYNKMKREFIRMRLSFEDLNNIPFELYEFYVKVLNYDYEKFLKFNIFSKMNHSYIIKQDLVDKIENFKEVGINTKKRNDKIIVSLTSFPERLFDIHFCLYSLLTQTFKPDKLILCLVKDEFPNGEKDIPKNVLNLKKNGLTIKWCDDFKSFTKLIPVLEDFPDEYIVTVDDDIFYPKDLLENIWNTYKKYPKTIISSRTRIMKRGFDNSFYSYNTWPLADDFIGSSFLNFITGVGGTLYFPNALSDIVFDKEIFEKLCPTGDDIWFWAMAVLNRTKITGNLKPHNELNYVNISREIGIDNSYTLWNLNQHGQNDMQLQNVLNYFPEILKIINDD